jgi:hypothetical protein
MIGGNPIVAVTLTVGDRVTWCHYGRAGRGLTIATRRGVIRAVERGDATARMGNGKLVRLPVGRFRKEGQVTEVTQILAEMGSQPATEIRSAA